MQNRRQILKGLAAGLPALTLAGPLSAASEAVTRGVFTGASGHVTTGTGLLIRDGASFAVQLGADFVFDGAPDPKVALGRDGYDASAILGALQKNTGLQVYPIPASIDAVSYNEIWIWCERFNVPLGSARLA
ncbi:MAG: DM13 domain-containing protein [Pseudomonadota bacterium]